MDRLDVLRAKYARAEEHRVAFSETLDRWLAGMPYGVRGRSDTAGWFVVRLVAQQQPPLELSLIFADMISNLRATLDHIVWALVEETGNATQDQLGFPCVLDRKDWKAALGSKLRNVTPKWIPAIEDAQPFTALDPRRHPMYVLQRLDIWTKHRLLIPFEPSTFDWEATYVVSRKIREDDHRIEQVAPPGTRLVDGAELARVRFLSKTADLHVTGIQAVTDAGAGWGPRLDEFNFAGEDALPDLMAFVGTQVDSFAPALRREAPSVLLP